MVHVMSYMNGTDMMTVTGNLKLGHLKRTYNYMPVQGFGLGDVCFFWGGGVFKLNILFSLRFT